MEGSSSIGSKWQSIDRARRCFETGHLRVWNALIIFSILWISSGHHILMTNLPEWRQARAVKIGHHKPWELQKWIYHTLTCMFGFHAQFHLSKDSRYSTYFEIKPCFAMKSFTTTKLRGLSLLWRFRRKKENGLFQTTRPVENLRKCQTHHTRSCLFYVSSFIIITVKKTSWVYSNITIISFYPEKSVPPSGPTSMRRRASSLPEVCCKRWWGEFFKHLESYCCWRWSKIISIFHEKLCIRVSAESTVSQHDSITGLEFDGLGFILEA